MSSKLRLLGGALRDDTKNGCVANYRQALFLKLGRGELTGELSQSLPPRWRSLNFYLLSKREHALRLNLSVRRDHPSNFLLSLDMPERGLLNKIYPRNGVKILYSIYFFKAFGTANLLIDYSIKYLGSF